MATPEVFRWEHTIPVPREELWEFVADTDRINRIAGLFPVRYTYKPRASGGSDIHAEATSSGITLQWIERPCEWVEPEYFRFTRDYSRGPFTQLVSEVVLRDGAAPGTTALTHTLTVTPRHLLGRLVAKFAIGVQTRAGFDKAYAQAPKWAAEREFPRVSGERGRGVAERELDRLLLPLGDRMRLPAIAAKLRTFLLRAPEEDLASLAPYALAARWDVDRRQTLRLFLHATSAGLFDIEYDLICPSCRRAKASTSRLAELSQSSHCPSCNIRYGVDFDRAVEVRFSPRPLGIAGEANEFCHAGPRNTPHRVAGWNLAPGEEREVRARLGPGRHQLIAPQAAVGVYFEAVDDADAPSEAALVVSREAITGAPPRLRVGEVALEVENATDLAAELMISRTAWADDAVTVAELATVQDFRDLFGAELLAPGAEFSIENQVFLFTDIVGSTALYEAIGDANAFGLVRRHFDVTREIYTRHDGALVKTIGDAIMCVFRRPADALLAALEMHEAMPDIVDERSGTSIELRIGLHRGPCIAMSANDRIDYFGTTVNTAARVQGKAGARETAVSPTILTDADARALVADRRLRARTERLTLKGLQGDHAITILTIPAAADADAAAS
ncbi:MAG: adenylate/guanylate cyclase domain-containing protein [Myxococcales bacterium]|nr:adenylate/guanylate cyclase domain-containing protein [Myxococcales bacterium]